MTTISWSSMFVAISGTPGVGKSSVAAMLRTKGYDVVDLNQCAIENNCISGTDEQRDTKLVDIKKMNRYIKARIRDTEGIVLFEGHIAHLLQAMDKIIILRCHPKELKKRLASKGWKQEKIQENVEAETIDIILCEAIDKLPEKNIFEIDTTNKTIESVVSSIIEIINSNFRYIKKYKIGNIDWSEEILKDFS